MTVLPALLAMGWLLTGLPLLLLGLFRPVLMLSVSLPLAILLVSLSLRWMSGRSPGLLAARGADPARTPWWALAALVAVAVAFGVDQLAYHSQQIIVQRDPGSYIQFANWIAHHGSLPIPEDTAAFGGIQHGLSFGSPGFYQAGHSIVPQFMAGLPMTLAAGFWLGGVSVAAALGALLGASGVLAFGGVVGRLVGPRWAPLGALILALALPEQFTSRSTYSEPLAQLLFLGGLCLVIDSFATDGVAKRGVAALGGLALGLTLLVRIDGGSDVLPLIPYCGLLLLGRHRQAVPLIGGAAVGALYGIIDGVILTPPYLSSISSSLRPLVFAGAALFVITGMAVLLLWRRRLPELRTNLLPNAAAAVAFVVLIGFIIRPYFQTVYGLPSYALQSASASDLAANRPVQPIRLYYEISLHWVFWYIGIPAVVLATIGAAVLARRCLRGCAPSWTLPLLSFAWIIFATLLRPAIMPDQPWASRRLVPGVLPGFILLAVWATSWLMGWLRGREVGLMLRGCIAAVIAAALILPAAVTTFGLVYRNGGPPGVQIEAVGLADKSTFNGEIGAVHRLCAAIPGNASVLIVNYLIVNQMTQVVRGMCGVPTAIILKPSRKVLGPLIRDIRHAGRRPVLLAAERNELTLYGVPPVRIMNLLGLADAHTLTTPPLHPSKLAITVWMSKFSQ